MGPASMPQFLYGCSGPLLFSPSAQIPSTPSHSAQSECSVESILFNTFPENIPAQTSFPVVDDVSVLPVLGGVSLGSTTRTLS